MIENEKTEWKREYSDSIIKSVVAFANTEGGKICVGFSDKGEPVGVENLDDCFVRITNAIRDGIVPDITMFTKYDVDEVAKTIVISISEGTNRPYFLTSKGMRSEGVYIRQGASSAPASMEQIRKFIRASEQNTFESGRALNQDLHFTQASDEFALKSIEFNDSKFSTLGIVNTEDNLYTNLGLLLSDECEHTIKAAIFNGDNKETFKDRKEFEGSLFKQLRNTFEFLELCNNTSTTFQGLDRIDEEDYPSSALREALLNSIVHRDYSFSGSIMINIFDDRIEFISLGGLVSGLSKEDILRGISQPRNKNLADVFYRLKHIEAYGTGIQRIFNLYKDFIVQPKILVTDNTFTMVLPNKHAHINHGTATTPITAQEQKVVNFIRNNDGITDEEIQMLLNIKKSRSYVIIKSMKEKGFIESRGKGSNKRYCIKEA